MIRYGFTNGSIAYLLIDCSGASDRNTYRAIRALPAELAGLDDYHLTIINFDTAPLREWSFTKKTSNKIAIEFDLSYGGGTSYGKVLDRVAALHNYKDLKPPVVYMLTDGWDSAGSVNRRTDDMDMHWLRYDKLDFNWNGRPGKHVFFDQFTKNISPEELKAVKENEVFLRPRLRNRAVEWLREEGLVEGPHPVNESPHPPADWARRNGDAGERPGHYYWFRNAAKAVHFALRWQGDA